MADSMMARWAVAEVGCGRLSLMIAFGLFVLVKAVLVGGWLLRVCWRFYERTDLIVEVQIFGEAERSGRKDLGIQQDFLLIPMHDESFIFRL